MLAALPVFHSFGLTGGILLPLVAGARVVTYPNPLHYKAIPELARKEAVTVVFGTDTFLSGWGRRAEDEDFASVRAAIAGAEAVKHATRALWQDRFGAAILEGYGATEASPVLALNTPAAARAGTVGRLLPGIAARLEPVPGIVGERLLVQGPNIMRGYLRPEAPDAIEAPPGGWYDTGDAVTIDADGFVAIRGRIKRFAKVGGEMVSLAAVEALAHRTWPDVAVAAVALPDPRKGNRVVLVLGGGADALDATLAPLQAQARAEGIAEIMLPARVIALPELPLLGSGKPDYPGLERLILDQERQPA
jgi:acyl-[acyl-carrier-protein]-phospholipid O-acyltransferase/long-chain-fatty-acid--[acyl-carrier-protein] ligase